MTDAALSTDAATAQCAAELAALTAALTAASDEQTFLAATMRFLHSGPPQSAYLIFLNLDAQGQPHEAQVVASWHDGQSPTSPPPGATHRLADFPATTLAIQSPAAPLLLADLSPELPFDAALLAHAAAQGHRAMAVLPLYNNCYGGWQGLVCLCFHAPHAFSPQEEAVYRLLMAVLATHIGGIRSQRALRNALTDMELLHKATLRLNLSVTLEEALGSLRLMAPLPDEAEVCLCSIENSPQGTPSWLTISSVSAVAGQPPMSEVGRRFYLPDIPFAKLYLSSPDAPLLIGDIASDARVDEYARSIYAMYGIRSTIVMALTLQGRWVGLLNVIWRRPVQFSEREQRMYQALAGHAALLLDNALMVERQRAALQEAEQKGSVLRTVLENIPVGIMLVEAPSGRPLLSNAAAAQLLGRELDMNGTQEQYTQTYSIVHPGSDRPFAADALPGALALATGTMHVAEMDVLPAGKERINLEAIGIPMLDEGGAVKNGVLVLTDLSTRKRAEQERVRLQEEIIRVQAAALAERGAPLIPITDDILVLPIIGSIDLERGQQLLSTVLQGTSQSRARVAIIDITGVRAVDTHAASVLTNAAQALRLLGVEPVLTGIRADVAQTLVSLGTGLEGIVTRSTLQAGIQFALRRLGKPIIG